MPTSQMLQIEEASHGLQSPFGKVISLPPLSAQLAKARGAATT
jgi:hypothetical protein